MDHFGIGAGVSAAVGMYFACARRTGRTTSLVESLKNGDRVVFADPKEARRVEQLCKERGVEVQCIVIPPKEPQRVFDRPPSEGRTLFDHTWLEQFYAYVFIRAAKDLDHFERETSGYGAPHRATKRQAEEIMKWRSYPQPHIPGEGE